MYKPKALKLFQNAEKLAEKGQLTKAIPEYKNAVKIDKQFYEAFNNLGNALRLCNRLTEAVEAYQSALKINPSLKVTTQNLANTLSELKKFEDALRLYDQVIKLDESQPKPYLDRSLTYYHLCKFDSALEDIDKYISLNPRDTLGHLHKGNILNATYNYAGALKSFETCITLNPTVSKFFLNQGNTLRKLEKFDAALESYTNALKLRPTDTTSLIARGNIFREIGQYENALSDFKNALNFEPESSKAHTFIGNAYSELGDYKRAIEHHKIALTIDHEYGDAHHNLAHVLLGKNDFCNGWHEYLYRDKKSIHPVSLKKISPADQWDGKTTTDQHLLIHGEQGLGDEVLFSNLLHVLKKNFYDIKVTVTCDKRLIPIYQRTHPDFDFIDRHRDSGGTNSSSQIHLGSLGLYLPIENNDFYDLKHPNLIVDGSLSSTIRNRINPQYKKICGISWKSQKTSNNTSRHKSACLADFLPILKKDEYIFVNLQYGDVKDEIEELQQSHAFVINQLEDIDNFNDIDSLLSLIDACDLVITVSNVTAHLAGSIDKPTYLISPDKKGKFWYWKNRDDANRSKWYPSIQIIDQGNNLDWNKAIEEISTLI